MDALEGILREVAEVVGLAVALVLAVTQLVAGLQVGALPEGLAVLGVDHVAAVVTWSKIVAGGEVGGVFACDVLHAVEVHLVVRGIVVLAVAHAALETQCDISAAGVQTAVELEHSPEVLVLSVGEARLTVAVHSEILGVHGGDALFGEWIGDVSVGIGIISGRERSRGTVVGARAAVRADEDVREGIGLPLEADVTVPAVVAREAL